MGSTPNFNFSGPIGRVRIYSFALTMPQITADMRGEVISAPPFQAYTIGAPCAQSSDPEDNEIPGATAAPALGAPSSAICSAGRADESDAALAILAPTAERGAGRRLVLRSLVGEEVIR